MNPCPLSPFLGVIRVVWAPRRYVTALFLGFDLGLVGQDVQRRMS